MTYAMTVSTSRKRQIVDITDEVARFLSDKKIAAGLCHVFALHTTAAVTTADLDPGTDLDMLDAFEAMMPRLKYRHPHNPEHVPDHIMSSMIGPSVMLPVIDGELVLGTWQRVILIEFDGPRQRNLQLTLMHSHD